MTFWTDERVEIAKREWSAGSSASMVAERLGCSRSAVLGKLFRLGLSTPSQRPRPKPSRSHAWRPKAAPKQQTPAQVLKTEPLPIPKADDIARVSFDDLKPHHCRWPVGDPVKGFCGHQKVPGLPYCPSHAVRAYRAPQPSRPMPEAVKRQPVLVAS